MSDSLARAPLQGEPAPGWTLERLTPPSRLFGANGLRTGRDGRIYVAQVAGSQVSAVDPDTGAVETISPMGGPIVGPDDLAFDDEGVLYATEITRGRVGARLPDGRYRVVCDEMPCANPITFHRGHLYAGECRPGGRILELDRAGGPPRVILEDVPMPNAFEVGPDGLLYFPVMAANQIWRVDPRGGRPEVVASELGVPDSVKFDADGYIVSTQVASGEVLRIDPRTGRKEVLARLQPGLDNCTFVGRRLFVSSITGAIVEILPGGEVRSVVPGGFQWPMGLAVDDAGTLLVADGGFVYELVPGRRPELVGMLFTPGFPGFTRGVTEGSSPGEWIVTTANGQVAAWRPAAREHQVLAEGFDRLMEVDRTAQGHLVFAEYGRGRVLGLRGGVVETLAEDLAEPVGVAVADDGACYVTESARGRILRLDGGPARVVADELGQPEGLDWHGGRLYVVDVARRELLRIDPASGSVESLARQLPVGAPPGAQRVQLGAVGVLSGPMTCFTGLAVGGDGTVYLSADAEGSVLAVRPQPSPP